MRRYVCHDLEPNMMDDGTDYFRTHGEGEVKYLREDEVRKMLQHMPGQWRDEDGGPPVHRRESGELYDIGYAACLDEVIAALLDT